MWMVYTNHEWKAVYWIRMLHKNPHKICRTKRKRLLDAADRDAAFVDFHQLPIFGHGPHGHTLLAGAVNRWFLQITQGLAFGHLGSAE